MEQNKIRIDIDDLLISKDLFINFLNDIEISDFIIIENKINQKENFKIPYNVSVFDDCIELNLLYCNEKISILYSFYLGHLFGNYVKKQVSDSNVDFHLLVSRCEATVIVIQVAVPEILENILNIYNKKYNISLKLSQIDKYEVPLCKIEGEMNTILMFFIGQDETFLLRKFEETSEWPF